MGSDRYQQLFEHSPVATLAVDNAGQVAECNRAACLAVHRSRDELLGAPVLRWLLQDDRARSKANFLECFRGIPRDWSVMLHRGDGLLRRFELSARPLTEPNSGEIDQVLVFLTAGGGDERVPVELARLAPLLQNLPGQFAAILDAEGRVRYSLGLARTHWHADVERVGLDFATLLAPGEHSRETWAALRREVQAGRPWSGVLWHVRADDSRFPVETFAIASLDPRTHEVVGTLVAGRDVGAEHEARVAAGTAGRLARIGELVTLVARQVDVPLRAALGALERSPPDTDGLAGPLRQIERLLRTLDGYTAEAGDVTEATLPGAALEEAVAEARASSGIEVDLKVPAELPPVYVEAGALGRVFGELLANACEAVGARPAGRVLVEAVRMPASVLVRVHDNGIGLPAQDPEKIFEPFHTTKPGHLGLGLATARRIVEASGGRIWVERSRSAWTTFCLEVPQEPAAGGVAFRPVPLVISRSRSLLLVDDDQGVRAMLRRLLEKVGFRVVEAWSGRSALAQLTSGNEFQALLTDLRMSEGTGYWLLTELRRDFPDLLRRTVIMTGDPSLAAVEKISRDTGCAVVRKPFDFRQLLEALDEAASRH